MLFILVCQPYYLAVEFFSKQHMSIEEKGNQLPIKDLQNNEIFFVLFTSSIANHFEMIVHNSEFEM